MAVAVLIGNFLDNGFSVVQTAVSLVIGFLGGVLIVKLVTQLRRDG